MPRFCPSCFAQMTDTAAPCPACGKEAGQSGGSTPPAPAAGGGMQDNLAAALAYLFITAIVFLVMEPYNKNKFVRFHSFQAIFLGVTSIAGHIVLTLIPIIGWILLPFFSLAIFILAVVAAVKAYGNQMWKLPVIGDLAEKQANA